MSIKPSLPRAVFTVAPHEGGWAVEHDGAFFDESPRRDEVLASANRRARAAIDSGRPVQVTIRGEAGFFAEKVR